MFDFVEETLHQMPLLVPMFIVLTLVFPVFAGRDDCFRPFFGDYFQQISRIIRPIGDHALKFKACQQIFGLGDVMALPARQQKAQRVAQRIDIYVDFGAKPTPTAP